MAAGRKQKGYKMVPTDKTKSRIIGVELKKNDPLAPVGRVRTVEVRTVAKPNCDQTIQAKKVSLNVKAPKASVRKKTISRKSGDGTIGAYFRTKRVKSKTRTADIRYGDGTHGVNFHK